MVLGSAFTNTGERMVRSLRFFSSTTPAKLLIVKLDRAALRTTGPLNITWDLTLVSCTSPHARLLKSFWHSYLRPWSRENAGVDPPACSLPQLEGQWGDQKKARDEVGSWEAMSTLHSSHQCFPLWPQWPNQVALWALFNPHLCQSAFSPGTRRWCPSLFEFVTNKSTKSLSMGCLGGNQDLPTFKEISRRSFRNTCVWFFFL